MFLQLLLGAIDDEVHVDVDAPFLSSEIKSAQAADDSISVVMKFCQSGVPPDKSVIRQNTIPPRNTIPP